MMMEMTISDPNGAEVAWAQVDLDLSSNSWYVQENRRWGSLGIAKQGYVEMMPGNVMWLGNKIIINQNNVIVLKNPPTKMPDPVHMDGDGFLNDPFNSYYRGARVKWTIPKLTPVRERILEICRILPPTPDTFLTLGTEPMTKITTQTYATGGVTNCGAFPGWVAGQLGARNLVPEQVTLPRYQNREGKWITPDPLVVTSPMTAWDMFIQKLEKMRKLEQGALWIKFDPDKDNRPLPGDIYVLSKSPGGQFAHVGIIIDSIGSTWTTADSGQGTASSEMIDVADPDNPGKTKKRVKYSGGMAAGYRRRQFDRGNITGEFGSKGYLKGWVDVDRLFAGWTR